MDTWRIPYELWLRIAPLIPPTEKKHRFGSGRPRVANYQVMNEIFFVLCTGCQWKALDATGICSGSTAHARFQEWRRAGLFERLWVLGLQEYDAVKGIDIAACQVFPWAGEIGCGSARCILNAWIAKIDDILAVHLVGDQCHGLRFEGKTLLPLHPGRLGVKRCVER